MSKTKPYTEGTLKVYHLKLNHALQLKNLYTQQLLDVNNILDEKGNTEYYPVCVLNDFREYKQELHDKLTELEISINHLECFTQSLRVIDNNTD